MKKLLLVLSLFVLTAAVSLAGEVKVLSIGYDNNPGHPVDTACQYWAKIVEERSGGSLRLELYPSTQLGKVVDVLDQSLSGDATAVLTSNGYFTNMGVPGWDVTSMPFLIESWADFNKVVDSDWWKECESKLEANGLKFISFGWNYGVRHLLSKRLILTPAEIQGLKIRIPADSVTAWLSLGTSPTPMSLGEAYMAMQQGTIDAIENPFTVLYDGSFYEVAKNLTLTGHKYDMVGFVGGTAFFNSLTPEEQNILIQSGKDAAAHFNVLIEKADNEVLDKLKAQGVSVFELTSEQKGAFSKVVQDYFNRPDSPWSQELRQTILNIIGK